MDNVVIEHLSKLYRVRKKPPKVIAGPPGEKQQAVRRARIKEVWALDDVSLRVPAGRILGVIGANGAGKTTLLKILGRVTPPTKGRAVVRGRVVPLLEVGAGYQEDLTGRENIKLLASLYGIPHAHVESQMARIIDFAGIGDFIDAPVGHYSSGMYLRLAFSVAINLRPDVLLADEVLAVGDAAFQERCLERVREVGDEGATILFVSHDMAAVTRLCDEVVWLDHGRVVASGDPRDVVGRYENSAFGVSRSVADSDPEAPCELGPVRLASPTGQQLGASKISEDVFVEFSYSVRDAGVLVRPFIDVSVNGQLAFRSVARDEHLAPAGSYRARLKIPGGLLSETVYTVDAGVFAVSAGRRHGIDRKAALTFRTYDTDPRASARGTFKGKIGGVLSPRLDWVITEENPVAAR